MASYTAVMHEIHVLLVDHDTNCLFNTSRLLETCHYRVTFVEFASAAITMLTSRKVKFDIVMANIDSPDLHGFKLLQHAVSMDLPVILMSVNDDAFMTMRALENGAYLQIKNPPTIEVMRSLWQHILKEKIRKMRERGSALYAANYSSGGIEFREPNHQPEENPNYGGCNNMQTTKKKGKSKKKIRERDEMDNEEAYSEENGAMNNSKIKKKVCTEWTQELHMKFLDAVHQLGEGRCFPKEIMDLMNVPGLTRMQVASHLQKCRNDKWRAPEERKAQSQQATQAISFDVEPSSSNTKKFGSMPRMGKSGLQVQVQVQDNSGQNSRTRSETEMQHVAGQENVGRGFLMTNTSHHRPLGTMAAGPSNPPTRGMNSSSNTRHDEFFHILDMDSMIRNSSGVNNPNGALGPYRFNQVNQNSGTPDSRSQGSSKPSSNGSDDSETRARD